MTGQPAFHTASIEVPTAEAATGVTRVVWTPTHGPLTVTVPPGTADGAVLWVPTPAGTVSVTVRVPTPFTPPGPASPHHDPGAPTGTLPPGDFPPGGFPPGGFPPGGFPLEAGGQPAAPSRTGRRNLIIGASLAALLVLGCCGGVLAYSGRDGGSPQAGKRNGAAAPSSAAPVTTDQYAQLLAASDSAIKAPFGALNTGDPAAFAKAAPAAAAVIRAEAGKLRAAAPPAGAESVHSQLTRQLESLGDVVDEAAEAKQECPAASPYTTVLQSGWADGIRAESKRLVAANSAFKFGGFLPAAPQEQNRRLKTGSFVKRPDGGGLGHLKIKNGAADTTVSLVPSKGKKPVLTVYVRGGGTFTATGIDDGTYRIYTASGKDWNAGRKGFTRNCTYSKFDDTFAFTTTDTSSSIWTITLTPVTGGNASTSNVDPSAFPN